MSQSYFSDREVGARPRVVEEINEITWGGIVALIKSHINDGSFGYRYPDLCPDGEGICGTDGRLFKMAVKAEIPDLDYDWFMYLRPQDPESQVPSTLVVLDLVEFCHRSISKPIELRFHQYFGHHHLGFNQEEGEESFRKDINRILARNGLAYELCPDGLVRRLAPEGLRQPLGSAVFQTDDAELDSILETARTKFLDPDLRIRKEALEKLWDAWERLKTLEPGKDKKESVTKLLNQVSVEPVFRDLLEKEAKALTEAGNTFLIRHSEIDKVPLRASEHVDYMFHRMFALIWLLLRTTGRGGA